MGVMEGDSAVAAIFGTQLEKLKKAGTEPDEAMKAEMEKVYTYRMVKPGMPGNKYYNILNTHYLYHIIFNLF